MDTTQKKNLYIARNTLWPDEIAGASDADIHQELMRDLKAALMAKFDQKTELCNLPESQFCLGGEFDTLSRIAGYASGKAFANDSRLWSEPLEIALNQLA